MTLLLLASAPASAMDEDRLPFSTVDHGAATGVTPPALLVIRTQAEWEALWARHVAGGGPPAPPAVDFSREVVLAVFAPERSTGGYEVAITAVVRGGSGVVVRYRETGPPPGALTIQQITRPYHLVTARGIDGPVAFERESP